MKKVIPLTEINSALSAMEWGSDEVRAYLAEIYGDDIAVALIDIKKPDFASVITEADVTEATEFAKVSVLYRIVFQNGCLVEGADLNRYLTEADAKAWAEDFNTRCKDPEEDPVTVAEVQVTLNDWRKARDFR